MLEVEAMSRTISPSSKKPYGVARVVGLWNLARSSFYAARHRERHPREAQKRGPKVLSDTELVTAIRQLLDEAVAAVALGVHLFVTFYEEPTLHERFGKSYEEYCRNVRRWWPRARGWDNS